MTLGLGAFLPQGIITDSTTISAGAVNVICKAVGHDWEWDGSKSKEPSCFEDGYNYGRCKRCGEETKYVIPGYTEYYWKGWELKVEPTCQHNGVESRTCGICGGVETRNTPVAEHKRVDGPPKNTVYPTCTARGYREYKCRWCSANVIEYFGEPTGHSCSEWKTVNPASCTSDGVEVQTCSKCNAVERRTVKVTGHSLTEWKTTKGMSCKQDGERKALSERRLHIQRERNNNQVKS